MNTRCLRRAEKTFRVLLGLVVLGAGCLYGAHPRETRITSVVKEVRLLLPGVTPRPAILREPLSEGTTIRTGGGARSELSLANQTIIRLGANTILSLSEGTRALDLGDGAILFQIPRGVEQTKIKAAAISVASKGATGVIERHGRSYVKLMLLEGEARVYLANRLGESLVMLPGQILITKPEATALPDPAHFDIAREMKTCLLVREFQPLPSRGLIEAEQRKQADLISKGRYIPSNLVIFGRGTLVTLVNPTVLDQSGQKAEANPAP
jgi:hypothetical protein